MNNRIREMSEYAWKYTQNFLDHSDYGFEMYDRKFAELIVKECIRYFNEDYQRDFDTLWREDLSKCLKEHFEIAKNA